MHIWEVPLHILLHDIFIRRCFGDHNKWNGYDMSEDLDYVSKFLGGANPCQHAATNTAEVAAFSLIKLDLQDIGN